MVDKSSRVDVDGSLKEREWTTEEFYAILNQHTDQVGNNFLKMSFLVPIVVKFPEEKAVPGRGPYILESRFVTERVKVSTHF